jgi:hypothetical protein
MKIITLSKYNNIGKHTYKYHAQTIFTLLTN